MRVEPEILLAFCWPREESLVPIYLPSLSCSAAQLTLICHCSQLLLVWYQGFLGFTENSYKARLYEFFLKLIDLSYSYPREYYIGLAEEPEKPCLIKVLALFGKIQVQCPQGVTTPTKPLQRKSLTKFSCCQNRLLMQFLLRII
jgi:hypothetical protein